ncbi:ligand-gated channel [Tardiphaga robiniae]|uniref:Ligand-gated channel n=1 Tax=Tardiphaga robiniae TaxID=943830 RepID=A0A164A4M6_9BRAD|nr:ligand-gated channel [Tardiphaga robiniae]
MSRFALLSSVCALSVVTLDTSLAQSSSTQSGAQPLPPVVVNQPNQQRRRATTAPSRTPRARTAVAPRAVQPPRTNVFVESPRGPIQGYVANRSSTGTKTNTPINETPQSISVVGAEQIRDQKPRSFDDVLRYVPGVAAGTFGADFRNDWFLIRGFKSDDNSVFLDGLQLFYTSYASWKLQPANMERVEILRGPSSILYGGSSPSGLVNVVSKMPRAEPIRYVETGVDNYGNAYFGFDINTPIKLAPGNGELYTRVVGQVQNGGTQTDFTPNNNYFIAPSLTWKPNVDTTLTILGSASYNETRPAQFLPYVGTVTNAPFGRIPTSFYGGDPSTDSFKREQEMLGYQFEHHMSDNVTFRQNARYAHVDVNYTGITVGDGVAFGNSYANVATGDLKRYGFATRGIADQGTLDSQVEYRFTTGILSHTALFGLDLKTYSINDTQGTNPAYPNINALNPTYSAALPQIRSAPDFNNYRDGSQTQNQLGLYLQDQIKLDRFTLVLSGRNDWVSNTRFDLGGGGSTLSRDDSQFSGRAGLIYNFDNGLAPYVSYATSYNPVVGLNFSTGTLLLPETGQQAEVGVKYQPVGFDGHFSFAYFDLKRQNVLTTNPLNPLQSIQNGEQTSRGLELEAVANLAPGLKVVGSFTTYNLFVSKDGDATIIGKVPTNTPRQLASAWADYTFQDGILRGFGFGGGVRYVGGSFADNINTLSVPSRTLGDLAVHYDWQNWRFAVNANNVTDEIYVANCSSANACFYGDRRRVTGSIGYKW